MKVPWRYSKIKRIKCIWAPWSHVSGDKLVPVWVFWVPLTVVTEACSSLSSVCGQNCSVDPLGLSPQFFPMLCIIQVHGCWPHLTFVTVMDISTTDRNPEPGDNPLIFSWKGQTVLHPKPVTHHWNMSTPQQAVQDSNPGPSDHELHPHCTNQFNSIY